MKTGVYAKKDFEIALTKIFILIHYKKTDYYGVRLFKDNKIIAFVERKIGNKELVKYFFMCMILFIVQILIL